MRYIYLALVFAGIYYPWRHFYAWFDQNGWDLGPMIDAWYVNEATTALTWDLTIAAIALCVWVVYEAVTKREWLWVAVIPVTFGIGVSAGLPLALLLLTLRRARTA
jgi:membrane-associated phospholipid phosphatase